MSVNLKSRLEILPVVVAFLAGKILLYVLKLNFSDTMTITMQGVSSAVVNVSPTSFFT